MEKFVGPIQTSQIKIQSSTRRSSRLRRNIEKIARGIKLPEDIEMLKTRVFPSNSPELPKDTLYVFPKKDAVSEYNLKMFQELEGSFEVFTAINLLILLFFLSYQRKKNFIQE